METKEYEIKLILADAKYEDFEVIANKLHENLDDCFLSWEDEKIKIIMYCNEVSGFDALFSSQLKVKKVFPEFKVILEENYEKFRI